MENQQFYQLFVEELKDVYYCEKQIIKNLPKMIELASLPDLKEALSHHLKETKNQVTRIEKIFSLLNIISSEKTCKGIDGLLNEAEEFFRNKIKSPTLDAAIIAAAQKVEHYEIVAYGTLKSFAKHLGFDNKIIDLLQDTLDEEGNADKKLTKLADGTFFSSGINKEAAAAR